MEKPIACSLDDASAHDQLGEWRTVLAAVTAVERNSAETLTMRFPADLVGVGTIVELAQREVACCPFFTFSVEVGSDGIALRASVPADAAPVLDAFATLAR